MKRLIYYALFAALALPTAGCSVKEIRENCLAPVSVHISGFSFSQEEFPATKTDPVSPATYDAVNAITLAFYTSDGTEQYKATQLKSDNTTYTTFGNFSLSLPIDRYTLVAIAHTTKDGSPFTLTSPTGAAYTGDHAYETFVCTQEVDITSTSAVEISATLDRIITQLKVVSTDGKAANVSKMRMTFSAGGKSFNPSTGLALSNSGFTNTVNVSADIGATSICSSVFFLATDEQTMNVTIETLDADGNTLYSKTVNNVTFQRNRITRLSGPLYASSAASSLLLNTDWLTQQNVSF